MAARWVLGTVGSLLVACGMVIGLATIPDTDAVRLPGQSASLNAKVRTRFKAHPHLVIAQIVVLAVGIALLVTAGTG